MVRKSNRAGLGEGTEMHLAIDYVHSYHGPGGARSQGRVRIYLPDEEGIA
jgi:hypothetical protein